MTFRTETIGDATLILGDCREVLPTLGDVSHVVSDPPYEDELVFGLISRKDGQEMPESLGFGGINADRDAVAQQAVRAAGGWVIFFTLAEGVRAWRDCLQAAGAKWDTTCFWVKPDASPRFNGQGPARGAECFVTCWAGSGYRRWNAGGKRGVYSHCVNTGRQGEHPTEKPLPLMREILADFTQAGEIVCDPFMGSGSTGVAAIQLGRRFVGIEQNQRWFDLACKRIEEAWKQPRLFEEPRPKAVQGDLLST